MQVDFYQLSRDPVEKVLPDIASRIVEGGGRLLVVAGQGGLLDTISAELWAWEKQPASFLAHGRADGAGAGMQPILLSDRCEPDNGARFVALADGVWRDAALAFERAFYFFDAATIDGARESWRTLSRSADVSPRFWKQEGRRWVQGP